MKIVLATINIVALIGATIWLVTDPDWEPAVTSIGLFGALLAQIFTSDKIKSKMKISQKSGKIPITTKLVGIRPSQILERYKRLGVALSKCKRTIW